MPLGGTGTGTGTRAGTGIRTGAGAAAAPPLRRPGPPPLPAGEGLRQAGHPPLVPAEPAGSAWYRGGRRGTGCGEGRGGTRIEDGMGRDRAGQDGMEDGVRQDEGWEELEVGVG